MIVGVVFAESLALPKRQSGRLNSESAESQHAARIRVYVDGNGCLPESVREKGKRAESQLLILVGIPLVPRTGEVRGSTPLWSTS